MSYKENLHLIQTLFFTFFVSLSYLLLFISALGISDKAIIYLNSASYYVRIYICLFLIWRFNPLRKHYEFTDLDRKIAFSAGVFILSTTALNKYINMVKERASTILQKIDINSRFI
jgi:uncharacterized BrkB/YihY/UPF0761 family membrane protein